MQGDGYLAIWSDLTPEDETDWAHWITREHGAERVGVPGFLACRIFRALGTAANRYFILYELEDENVVVEALERAGPITGPAARIECREPRPCRRVRALRRLFGISACRRHIVAPLRLDAAPSFDPAAMTSELARLDRIIAARVLLTDAAKTSIKTNEKGMRSNDGSFAALVLIEGLDEAAVRAALHHLRASLPEADHSAIDDLPLYRLAFSLPKRLLPG